VPSGPGLVTGADDDPSRIATYSQAGAQFGFALNWIMLLSYPLMTVVQEMGVDLSLQEAAVTSYLGAIDRDGLRGRSEIMELSRATYAR
jgi:hypothetical protein